MFVATSTLTIIAINRHPLPFLVLDHSCIHYLPEARASGSLFTRVCYFCLSRLWEALGSAGLYTSAFTCCICPFFFFFFALYGYFGVIFIIFYGLPHMISRLGRIGWDEDMSRSRHVLGKEVC